MLVVLVLGPLVGAAHSLWPRSAERRTRKVDKWAATNLVTLTPEVAAALDRALTSRMRVNGVLLLVLGAAGLPVAFVGGGFRSPAAVWGWTVLLAVSLLFLPLMGNRQLARPWFTVGQTRSARPRAVGLDDYLFPPVRRRAWASGLVCLAAAGLVLFTAESSTDAAGALPGVALAVAVAAAEWLGRRTASRPQPARDVAELYALDAWRSDVVTSQFNDLGLSGLYVTMFLMHFTASETVGGILFLTAVALFLLVIATRRSRELGIIWTRHRLWPSLQDGESVDAEVVAL